MRSQSRAPLKPLHIVRGEAFSNLAQKLVTFSRLEKLLPMSRQNNISRHNEVPIKVPKTPHEVPKTPRYYPMGGFLPNLSSAL